MTVYMEAKRRVFAEMMAKMDEHLQQTGELVVPDIDIFSVDKLAIELSRAVEYVAPKPRRKTRSDKNKKRSSFEKLNGTSTNLAVHTKVGQSQDGG